MFVYYCEVDCEMVDVRTTGEFDYFPVCEHNIPIIDDKLRSIMTEARVMYFFAPIIIGYGLYKNRKSIKKRLLEISNNGEKELVFACSKGRLRSPYMHYFAKNLGIRSKVLKRGIKGNFNIEYMRDIFTFQ